MPERQINLDNRIDPYLRIVAALRGINVEDLLIDIIKRGCAYEDLRKDYIRMQIHRKIPRKAILDDTRSFASTKTTGLMINEVAQEMLRKGEIDNDIAHEYIRLRPRGYRHRREE